MTTPLVSQLQALASAQGKSRPNPKHNTQPSILFDSRQAADVDSTTILSLASSGLEELSTSDIRFRSYKKTLFSMEGCQIERELQGQEFNAKLDASIHAYLCILSDFLLLTAAHQTLEYLIRQYKIHVYNVDDLIRNIIPYHETSLFVRIVQLTHIENTRWHFLEGVKKSGAAPPRGLLVQQCLRDLAVLEAICESGDALAVPGKNFRSKTAFSFSVVIITEALAGVKKIDSILVNKLLHHIVHCFEKGSPEEFQVGGLMIIGALGNKASLSEETNELFFDLMAKLFYNEVHELKASKLMQMALMVMAQLMQTQSLRRFPQKAFKHVVKVREFPENLSRINKNFNVEKFIILLVKSLVNNCVVSPHYANVLLQVIITLPLRSLAESIALDLLSLIASLMELEDITTEDWRASEMKKLFIAIENQFPEELDAAVNQFLKSSLGANNKRKHGAVEFLNSLLEGSLHSPMGESNQSIYMSLEHSEAHIREKAVQRASVIAKNIPKMKMICAEALVRRLHDNELSVVRSVLSVEGLAQLVQTEQLLESQTSILSRCFQLLEKGSKPLREDAVLTGTLCMKFLASVFLDANPSFTQRVGYLLLSNMLLSSKTWKLNLAAVKSAKNVQWSFFSGLSAIEDETLKPVDVKRKEARTSWLYDVNKMIVTSMAGALMENLDLLPMQLTPCATTCRTTKPFILLVLSQCLAIEPEALTWNVVNGFFTYLKQEWLAVESRKDCKTTEMDESIMIRQELFTADFFKLMQAEPRFAYLQMLWFCMYRILLGASALENFCTKEQRTTLSSILDDLFMAITSLQSKLTAKEHLGLFLREIPFSSVQFLSRFFNAAGETVPLSLQLCSLNVLFSDCDTSKPYDKAEMQLAIPHLLVSLAKPLKAIRKAACECLRKLYNVWRECSSASLLENASETLQSALLESDAFEDFLKLLLEFESSFVANESFLSAFLAQALSSSSEERKRDPEAAVISRLNGLNQKSILSFILGCAIKLPIFSQYTLIVALKGAGHILDQALETKELLETLLSRWKEWRIRGPKGGEKKLSQLELELFKVLLQVHLHHAGMFSLVHGDINGRAFWFQTLMDTINVDAGQVDPAVVEPCCAALDCLDQNTFDELDEESQDVIAQQLISLRKYKSKSIQSAARLALDKLHVHCSLLSRYINGLLKELSFLDDEAKLLDDGSFNLLNYIDVFMEFLITKENVSDMCELIVVLFMLLRKLSKLKEYCEKSEAENTEEDKNMANGSTNLVESLCSPYVQQLVLTALEKLLKCCQSAVTKESLEGLCDVDFLVEFIHSTTDTPTRNQSLSLLTILAQVSPECVLRHIIRVFSILGETTLIQDNNHSYAVTEKLISVAIPTWLEKTQDPKLLLEILVNALPQIPTHRRTPLLKSTLRLMQEAASLHVLLYILLERSLPGSNVSKEPSQKRMRDGKKKTLAELDVPNWCKEFSSTICEHFTFNIRLPAILKLLKATQLEAIAAEKEGALVKDGECERLWQLQERVVKFIASQLGKSGLSGEIESIENEATFRDTFVCLLEEVFSLLQRISIESPSCQKKSILKIRTSLQDSAGHVLECITNLMSSMAFAEGMINLLKFGDSNTKLRALQLIMKKMKYPSPHPAGKQETGNSLTGEDANSEGTPAAYKNLVLEMGHLLDYPYEEEALDIVSAAVSAVNICCQRLAKRIPLVFVSNLQILITNFQKMKSSATLQCIASIVSETGLLSLPALSELIKGVVMTAKEDFHAFQNNVAINGLHSNKKARGTDLHFAILTVLEAIAIELGSFLSPYLRDILDLLILEPVFNLTTDKTLKEKAEFVRNLLPKMIPVRLLINPLVSTYDKAVQNGEASTLACIDSLSLLVTSLDRSSVASYYKKLFELCLAAFDIRQKPPKSFISVTTVETRVILLFTGLVLKLSESTFKPLFVRMLEWAESEITDNGAVQSNVNVHRNILLYRLVNQLADKLRSVFVPYFQYLLKGCVKHLTSGQDRDKTKSRKKRKVASEPMQQAAVINDLTSEEWHLRQLIICALHKCFLYDNNSFLDAQKFQLLLGPLTQQIGIQKPSEEESSSNRHEWVPSVQDMDQALISCLGQMALSAGTDLLWKPLNHEVLLCTRSEAVHARVISLEVVKFLVEHLKEDYLVLLPETIPFLAELLEDQDPTVVGKSQEIIKHLESLSGESLSQYL